MFPSVALVWRRGNDVAEREHWTRGGEACLRDAAEVWGFIWRGDILHLRLSCCVFRNHIDVLLVSTHDAERCRTTSGLTAWREGSRHGNGTPDCTEISQNFMENYRKMQITGGFLMDCTSWCLWTMRTKTEILGYTFSGWLWKSFQKYILSAMHKSNFLQ